MLAIFVLGNMRKIWEFLILVQVV